LTTDSKKRFRKEHELMPNRVREVLLVSSQYDAFVLEEDGHLTEQIFVEYKSLSLSSAPRFSHVTDRDDALSFLQRRSFDLVLCVAREASKDLVRFGREVKKSQPDLPVVILGFESANLAEINLPENKDAIDAMFIWNGDAKILLAIIKHLEDKANVDNDIEVMDVRVILVVEDSIRYFSSFLAALYPELMKQSQSLFAEGINRLHRLMRMRTRPKILHASSYEEAVAIYEKYEPYLLAVISDVGFPRKGKLDRRAGLRLVQKIRAGHPDMPILLQSAERDYSDQADELDVLFVDKGSSGLLQKVRSFLVDYLGFGPFTFRLPDGQEVAQAKDLHEFAVRIRSVPAASLEYHTHNNHISNWLMARSEFELAEILRRQPVQDFDSIEDIRDFLLNILQALFRRSRQGVITDFPSAQDFDNESLFQRVGQGSLGGKARGIAFLNHLLTYELGSDRVAGLRVQIPQSFCLTTEFFERFLEENKLHRIIQENKSDAEIMARFKRARLPASMRKHLRTIVDHVFGPLAVRSSSLLEDDMAHPFAGIYGTVMIPNNDDDEAIRLKDLSRAIRYVYASTYLQNARSYLENTGHSIEEEQMAIVLQQVVGQRHGDFFYPHFSGVAHSYNYYPIGPQKAEEGVTQAVLGLGRMVVDGGESVRFCPRHPQVIPQFSSPAAVLKNSQRNFYALDLNARWDTKFEKDGNQVMLELERAKKHGTLAAVGSTYDPQNDTINDGIGGEGPLVVTFNNILKHKIMHFASAMDELLELITKGMGTPIELEYACDMGNWGKQRRRGQTRESPILYLLQVRPILVRKNLREVQAKHFRPEQIFCRTDRCLGNGQFTHLSDIVFVKPEAFNPAHSPQIAREVDEINEKLAAKKRQYVLIGPGRWGSSDHWLGIPVRFKQISAAKIIVEASPEGYDVDPSQGTHFFHNLTALELGYFTIPPGATRKNPKKNSYVDWAWLKAQPVIQETPHLLHVRPADKMVALMDGRHSTGFVAWCTDQDYPCETSG